MKDDSRLTRLAALKIDRSTYAVSKQRFSWRRAWFVAILAGLVAAAWFWQTRPPLVRTGAVLSIVPSQQLVQITASGHVVAQMRAAVASKASGRLTELLVREGSRVRKGDVLARLDSGDLDATVLAARASLRQAQARARQADAEHVNAQSELRRSLGLEAQGFVSPQAVEVVRTRVQTAAANAAAVRADADVASAQLALQVVNRDYAEIRAPFSGMVLMRNANVGDIITPLASAAGAQGSVVTMADMASLQVETDVSESTLAKARVGQQVEIALDAIPDERFRGRVAGIVPTIDRAKATVTMKIRFETLDPRILPEMSAKVAFLSRDLTAADESPVLAINPSMRVTRDGKALVYRLQFGGGANPVVEAVPVEVGPQIGDLNSLRPGSRLHAGDRLVIDPASALLDGSPVRLATD